MASLKIDHQRCTECRMCYIVCREIDINAVYVALEPLHRIEIDLQKCTYPGCTACLMYCPAEGSIVEVTTGRSMVPPPPRCGRRFEPCTRSLKRSSINGYGRPCPARPGRSSGCT